MDKYLRQRFLFVFMALSLICALSGLREDKIFASTTAVDPIAVFSNTVVVPNGTTIPQSIGGPVFISFDDASDLVAGTKVLIDAPSGTKFALVGTPSVFLDSVGTGGGGNITVTGIGASGQVVIVGDASGATMNAGFLSPDSTQLGFTVNSLTATPGDAVLRIGTNSSPVADFTTSGPGFIGLLPTSDATEKDLNTPNLTLKITTNSGSTANVASANVGTIHLLAEPQIVGATQVSSVETDVKFNVDVDGIDASDFLVNASGTASARTGGSIPTSATRQTDKKVVRLLHGSVDFTKAPNVGLSGTGTVVNNDGTTVKNSSTKTMLIKKENAAIQAITVTKTRVGIRRQAGVNSQSNKFSASFSLNASSQPFKFKLIKSSDTAANPLPMDTGDGSDASSNGLTAKIDRTGVPREDTTPSNNDEFNFDVFVVEGSNVASGVTTVDFVLGTSKDAFITAGETDGHLVKKPDGTFEDLRNVGTVTPIKTGEEIGIQVAASLDNFNTIVKSPTIIVDKKGPSLITSGPNSPSAPTRKQIKLKFNEPLDSSNATSTNLWAVGEGSDLTKHHISSVSQDADRTGVTIHTATLFGCCGDTTVNVSVHEFGTPTAAIEDEFHNPVFGTDIDPLPKSTFKAIGTVSAPACDCRSLSVAPKTPGNQDVSNNDRLVDFVITADSGLAAGNFHIQAFDATEGFSKLQSKQFTGANLKSNSDSNAGTDITESGSGNYTGTLQLFSGLTSSAIQVWVVISSTAPVSQADWASAIKSSAINVDNTAPTVNPQAEYIADTNRVRVVFSEGMNVAKLGDATNNPKVVNTINKLLPSSIDIIGAASVSSDKKEAVYQLFEKPNDVDTFAIDFTSAITDDAGNPISDLNVQGIDRSNFTTISKPVPPSPTPTPTPVGVAPTAEFEADPIGGFAPLAVRFTDKSSGNPTRWQWDFGDGNFSAEQNPTNTYQSIGDFTVRLTVANSAGSNTEEKIGLIAVDPVSSCTAAFNADKTTGFAPLEVKFTDKSTGGPTSWTWDFGDGDTSSVQNPTHTYQIPGIFSVTLSINAACGTKKLTLQNLIHVEELPALVAGFSASPTTGFAPLDVQFNNLSTGNPTSFSWRFGDGGSSAEENPLHTYKSPGIFTPSLLVSSSSGSDIETKTNLINIQLGEPPTADFQASPLTGFAPLKVQFTDTSAGNIDNWTWSFGDGATSSLQNPTHDYLNPGFYNVKLIVSGLDGTGQENKVNLINILEGEGPTAAFFAEPLVGNAPFKVHFFDTSSGEISNRTWKFGDGDTSEEQDPVHTYKNTGSFNVRLTVSSKNATSVETKTGLIEVKDGKTPTAGFVIEDEQASGASGQGSVRLSEVSGQGSKELNVKFNDISSSPDGEIIKREWDFGDGTRLESSEEDPGQDPEHRYIGKEGDTFTVTLTVQNPEGLDTVTKPSFVAIKTSGGPGGVSGGKIALLTVEPETARSSLRMLTAIVTALDKDGNPVQGVEIEAEASGTNAKVRPPSKKTNKNGDALFRFRFDFTGKGGKITFAADGKTATISQKR